MDGTGARTYDHLLVRRLPWRARGLRPARVAAVFAAFLLAEAELGRRFALIDLPALWAVLAAALVVAVVGALALAVALRDIWRNGAAGFGHALATAALLALVFAPFAAVAAVASARAPLPAVTTDPLDPPPLATLRVPGAFDPDHMRRQHAAAPDLVGRRFTLSTVELHAAARATAVDLGWHLRRDDEPDSEDTGGGFAAEVDTPVLSISGEVAVRIRATPSGARIDLSAATPALPHDLGLDAWRVRGFLAPSTRSCANPPTSESADE
ncbi:DUF1499 domain-containing protein [Methylobrevis pamukkalensis]|uniref:DUF1499 domain-containing protein n=1 Tax=Methylobrevis pamukkalensis TaxID=1439726 RepID=UPI00084600DA|nr:DUF1499 domain-containing protein [Methylobrevis pamukkalensis]